MENRRLKIISIIVIISTCCICLLCLICVKMAKVQNKREIRIKVDNEVINMEQYLCNVVINEMKDYDNYEAIKAFCVIARSNFMYDILGINSEDNKKDTTVLDIDYANIKLPYDKMLKLDSNKKRLNKIKRAIRETNGEVLLYKKQLILLCLSKKKPPKTLIFQSLRGFFILFPLAPDKEILNNSV